MLSRRSHWASAINQLTTERLRLSAAGNDLIDLTESNPTLAGIGYPSAELAQVAGTASQASYNPDPRGLLSAREALAAYLTRMSRAGRGLPGHLPSVDPDDLMLTASTSEAYSWLLKLLADPGDEIVTPTPSYPLLDHLAALENVRLIHAPLEWIGGTSSPRWAMDVSSVEERLSDRSRAVILIHPNNPTGSYVRADEQTGIAELASRHDVPLISDEVFYDFALEPSPRAERAAFRDDVLSFSLGGLSKSAGLPHWKLGWIHVGGPLEARKAALAGLELIADTFLSVSSIVQEALPKLLSIAPGIQEQILRRVRRNYQTLKGRLSSVRLVQVLPVEGGWSAVIRVPSVQTEEAICLELLREQSLIVQPGYFFDFPAEGYLVVSLLTESSRFDEGISRLAAYFEDEDQDNG